MKKAKLWGITELLQLTSTTELHRIVIQQGGKSSIHHHEHKHNLIYVESGTLAIHLKDKIVILNPGKKITLLPNQEHQFKALTRVVAYEFYWVNINMDDIVRQ